MLRRHGAALGALGPKYDEKWLNIEGRTKLRKVWDRVRCVPGSRAAALLPR